MERVSCGAKGKRWAKGGRVEVSEREARLHMEKIGR